jgi:hypothetical protein
VWRADLHLELSQGDILTPVAMGVIADPLKPVKRITAKGHPEAWAVMPPRGIGRDSDFISTGKQLDVIVVSYDCEMQADVRRVLCAPVGRLSTLEPAMQGHVLARRVFSKFPLVGVPTRGDCYAEFRAINAVHRSHLPLDSRLASISDDSIEELKAALIAFFTRYELPLTMRPANDA